MQLQSKHTDSTCILTNIYAPCEPENNPTFLVWFQNIKVPQDCNWMIVGDFNLLRKPEDRNKPGGNVAEMLAFNEAISALGINEIPLQGRKYTWSNM